MRGTPTCCGDSSTAICAEGALFFDEDAFGNQCKHVCFFDAETGELTEFSDDLEAY